MEILSPKPPPEDRQALGRAGEDLVLLWLEGLGWELVARNWRCRWGELDLILRRGSELAFVEVKTRSLGNWDQEGLEALDRAKRRRMERTASIFLHRHPPLLSLYGRFDVALVLALESYVYHWGPVLLEGRIDYRRLVLTGYLEDAFEAMEDLSLHGEI